MAIVSIPSLDIFAPAIAYHTSAQRFLSEQDTEILSRSKALSDELHISAPQQAAEFDKMMQTLAQRFTDEAQLCQEAMANLSSHFNFLATAEAALSGTSPETLPALTLPNTSNWIQIHNTPVNGCFDELESKLYQYKQDLDAFEPRVRDFEHLIWVAVNQPGQLKNIVQVPTAGWEPDWLKTGIQDVADVGMDAATTALRPAIDFIQAHQTDIYNMLDQMRQGFEKIFLPRTDPKVLQAHIDYLSVLKTAYDTQIRSPFADATQPIATQYQPPTGQDSYQQAWPTIAEQQYHTSMALGNAIGKLQQIQGLNELIVTDLIIIVVAVGVFLVAIAVTAFIVTIIGTLPAMFVSGTSAAGGTIGVTTTGVTFGSVLGAILTTTFLGTPVWGWATIVTISIVIGVDIGIEQQPIQQLLSGVTTFAVAVGEQAIKDLEGLKKAIEDAVDQGVKDLEEAIAEITIIEIAIRLILSFPGLSREAAMILAQAIAIGTVTEVAVTSALARLCAGLLASSELADLVVQGLQGIGDGARLLPKLFDYTRRALAGDIEAQRVLTVVRDFGLGRIEDIGVDIPGGEMDIELKNPPGAIEVGGANSKSLDKIAEQVLRDRQYWQGEGVSNPDVEAWMQAPTGGDQTKYAKDLDGKLGKNGKGVTFGAGDLEKCT